MFRDLAIKECVDLCLKAQVEAERCAAFCLGSEEATDLRRCIQTCQDAADVCQMTVRLLARNSGLAQNACELCVDVCVNCRDECAKHELEVCQQCAEACHQAAEKCERLTLQPL